MRRGMPHSFELLYCWRCNNVAENYGFEEASSWKLENYSKWLECLLPHLMPSSSAVITSKEGRERRKKTFYWWCRVCTHVGKALFEENLNSVCVYVNDIWGKAGIFFRVNEQQQQCEKNRENYYHKKIQQHDDDSSRLSRRERMLMTSKKKWWFTIRRNWSEIMPKIGKRC